MPSEDKKYPKVTTGTVIINRLGKVFLMRSETRFQKQYHIPGGHVEWGETLEDCLKREVKEETGLTVYAPEFIRPVEFVFSPYYDENRHIIPLDFAVRTDDEETAVQLDDREGVAYAWFTEDEINSSKEIEATTKETILMYFESKKKDSQCAEYKSGWQRAVADYQNLQKEVRERRQEMAQMSEQQILEEFIPVYDNLKLAINNEQLTNNKDPWLQGVRYVAKQFSGILKAHNIEEIKTVGEKLDTKFHETVGEEESDTESGIILKEVDGGYIMGGRVIKVAKVIISKRI